MNVHSIQEIKGILLNDRDLGIKEDNIYSNFPIYKGLDDEVIVAPLVAFSRQNGILIFEATEAANREALLLSINELSSSLDNLYTQVLTRLLRNVNLKASRKEAKIEIKTFIFSPLFDEPFDQENDDIIVVFNEAQLVGYLKSNVNPVSEDIFEEAISTFEGAKGILAPVLRDEAEVNTRAYFANQVESEIARFDQRQKALFLQPITGLSRIRGLAGSGKTVILCMKAALLHLQFPQSMVLYTFYTKSLYQHVRRMITRFYRQFNDQDPDWTKMLVRHAWGNYSVDGVYRDACADNGVNCISFDEAKRRNPQMPFDSVCQDFLERVNEPKKPYDYILIDEGQDFPKSFIRMCRKMVVDDKMVYAYDDLQTIFQSEVPAAADIFGPAAEGEHLKFAEDLILYKCYRNPREVIFVAHAIGFGIFSNIVQMIENEQYWREIGYSIADNQLKAGNRVTIERPRENSLKSISDAYPIDDIIMGKVCGGFKEEIEEVTSRIEKDIKYERLRPEDVLVITVDDRYATTYLRNIAALLDQKGILCNNIHADKYSVKDFRVKNQVTLSTIHKAKGNEAFSVYIVGIDSLVYSRNNIRERNLLFTAMTRSKGWVYLSGIGAIAREWINEIETAKRSFPKLVFTYPNAEHLRTMKLDLMHVDESNQDYRILDNLLERMTSEEINMYIEQRQLKKRI